MNSLHSRNTLIFTNFKRTAQLLTIIERMRILCRQSVITVWDNSPKGEFPPGIADNFIQSSMNFSTSPRWWLASIVDTYYFTIIDDDFMVKNEEIFHRCFNALSQHFDAVGLYGVILNGKSYSKGNHIFGRDCHVDVIKGKFFMGKTHSLKRMQPIPVGSEDDIIASSYFRGRCGIVKASRDDVEELEEPYALSHRFDHMDRRNRAAIKYLSGL